ncbi:MAG: zinc ribbon domain-containing protein [Clostridia bacterium]|nr:zinc ribbon domain-containing protein [Clostridia bacterium]
MKICLNCQAQNEDNVMFCVNCGNKFSESLQDTTIVSTEKNICPKCGYEDNSSSHFCGKCGHNLMLNVEVPTEESLKSLADTLNSQMSNNSKKPFDLNNAIIGIPKKCLNGLKNLFNKIGKKKLIILSSVLAFLIVSTILIAKLVVPFAPHYFKGNSAVKAADYPTAIAEYELAGNFLDTNSKLNDTYYLYAETLYSEEKYYDAAINYNIVTNYEDTEQKLIQCGTNLLDNKKYDNAVEVFEMVESDSVTQMKSYASAMLSMQDGSYQEAKKSFIAAGDYSNSKTMVNACDLMLADKYCNEGKFDEALKIYNTLPEDFVYNEISVSGRKNLLLNSKPMLDAMGRWNASDNYIESRNIYKRTGSWDNWYYGHDNVLSGQYIEVECTLNNDNTFDINGEVCFYKFDDYSSLSAYCKAKSTTRSINISNVTSIPSTFSIDSNTTLYYSNGIFSIKYSERDNYSSYFYNMYNSSVTYGNR